MAMESTDKISGCIAIEETAAVIYRTLMRLFPEEKDFWEVLYRDEIEHSSFLSDADYLEMFTSEIPRLQLPSWPFIKNTLEYANYVGRHIRTNPVSFEEVLNMTLKLEESMVEIFTNELMADLNSDDDKDFVRDFENILLEERGHVSKIKNMMIKKGFIRMS